MSNQRPSYFPSAALDHAFAGIGAGAVATVCMNPLDLVKTRFQVDTSSTRARAPLTWKELATGGRVGQEIGRALKDIVQKQGWGGLYRGLSPNVAGNSASWGLYFLWYTMIKQYMAGSDGSIKLSAGQHLLAASESGAITALMTNPIWVVKTRMFTTSQGSAGAYRGLWHGLSSIARNEGLPGLYKGAGLALVGVSNGAIQFMAYEELKKWRNNVAARRAGVDRSQVGEDSVKLSNFEYIVMSGSSKMVAIFLTYPYQVIRSRIQNHATSHIYPNIPTCIRLTYRNEGVRAFYKGMAANALRILPGTCVTFVVYENISWWLRENAEKKVRAAASLSTAAATAKATAGAATPDTHADTG